MTHMPRGDEESAEPRESSDDAPTFVVGIGASAGGIAAISRFFSRVPADAPFAYVVILHLSPDHDSKLAEVLQRSTALPVTQVHDAVPLVRNHVYVIPPSQTITVIDKKLLLAPITRWEERKAPVDMFFRTLADAYGSNAAAVVLSGTGPNGSNGLKRVKERGGLTIAQAPGEAEYADMPSNAIATGMVDCVLTVEEMSARILRYWEGLRSGAADLAEDRPPGDDAEALREIMMLVRARTAQDFSNYKPATVKRRIARRMSLHGVSRLSEYARLMHEHPDEGVALMKELLISVTNFFRDPDAFAVLEQRVIPRLFASKGAADQLRVWVPGCATGEEAYSIAMLLVEHAATLLEAPAIQVFASDLDEQAIVRGREALYSEADIADVPPDRLKRFFQRETAGYRIRRDVRELVLFAHHNVIKDPPFSHLDLISCRNLLIYLNRTIQERLIATFHYALRPGGLLLLGTAETPDAGAELFVPLDKASHVYESRPVASRPAIPFAERPTPATGAVLPRRVEPRPAERMSPGDLHLRLLEQFAPPSIVVTEEHTIVHISEHAGRFLQLAGGEPSRDLMKVVHPDLRVDLRTALHLAAQQRSPVEVRRTRLSGWDGDVSVTICVKPVLRVGESPQGYFLVLFEEGEPVAPLSPENVRLTSPTRDESRQLEEELGLVRSQLQATVEQYETQAEESKATNEELQAMNEELRSAAEELETSKEELQSLNEELSTVNQELKNKLEELRITNNDLQNLIASTEIGAIFLDKELRVKLSTRRAQAVFHLLPSDVGRKLSDITTELVYPELYEDVARVLTHLQAVDREVRTRDGRWYFVHVVPYRTIDDRIDGVAITLQDITRRWRAEGRVRAGEERLRLLIDSAVDYAIFTMTNEGTIDSWNSGAQRVFGYAAEEIVGRDCGVLFTPEDRASGVHQQELVRTAKTGRAEDERWHIRKNGERFYCSGVTTLLATGEPLGFAKIARDLTAERQAAMALEQAHADLDARVRQRTTELQEEVAQHAAARSDVTNLVRKIVTAQEHERARIARDLHDQFGQQLTALRMTIERHGEHCAAAGDLHRALTLAREADAELDFLAWELRPTILDDLGLLAALPRFVHEWSAHYGLTSEFQTTGDVAGALTREAEVAFYRIAQEALNNVVKHAQASRVDVLLERRDGTVVLLLEDDGVGFDAADLRTVEKGVGLLGMRERAALIGATLQIESSTGGGTTVYLRCPVQAAEGSAT